MDEEINEYTINKLAVKKTILLLGMLLSICTSAVRAEVNPNFYIYLCFGQSNMEGNAAAESQDQTSVGSRFQMLATTNFDSPKRTMGQWYAAVPPIVSPAGKLGPTDYFGRTMMAALPKDVKVGVVAVAMGGSPIEMFDKDKYQKKLSDNPNEWWAILAKQYYGGNPYQRLIDMAKKAQEAGVIKGILLHQGCSNNGDPNWPTMVKKIYNDMLSDLGLNAADVPLFVGETLHEDQGGACWYHNTVIAKMPSVVPTSHIISSEGCPGNGTDPWHFNASGYRILGRRYAAEALRLMGRELIADSAFVMPSSMKKFYCVRKLNIPTQLTAVPGQRIPVIATYQDGHEEDVSGQMAYESDDIPFDANGFVPASGEYDGRVVAIHTDFSRKQTKVNVQMSVRYFPFDENCLRPLLGTATFNKDERTLQMKANSGIGWVYDGGADMSAFKYLVVKLADKQTCGAQVRLYGQTDDFTKNYATGPIGSKTLIGINLESLRAGGKKLQPSDIRAIGFFATKEGLVQIDDIYLTNNDDFTSDAVLSLMPDEVSPNSPVYDLRGIRVGTEADLNRLPRGVYVTGGKKVVRK